MYSRRVQHMISHVKKLQTADPNPHAWQIDLVTFLLSLQMQDEQKTAFDEEGQEEPHWKGLMKSKE